MITWIKKRMHRGVSRWDWWSGLQSLSWVLFSPGPFFSRLTALLPLVPNCPFDSWSLQQKAELHYPKTQKLNLNQHFFPTATSCSDPKWFEKFKSLSKYCQMKFLISRSQPINYLIITTQTFRLKEVHWDDLEPYLPFIISFKTAPQKEVCIYPKNLNVLAKFHAEI